MATSIVLNGFEVEPRLAALMVQPDWAGKRTDEPWLQRFPPHRGCSGTIPFVNFISIEHAVRENRAIHDPDNQDLNGRPDLECPPGDFDPKAGYLIGFTDWCDAAICVDLRPASGPSIIYDDLSNKCFHFSTAFESLDAFVAFYIDQHGA